MSFRSCRISLFRILSLCAILIFPSGDLCAQSDNEAAFHALGLLASPEETAEDILLRAHAGDTFAVALAVVGYDLGVHGFPEDRALSLSMIDLAGKWCAPDMEVFLRAFWGRGQARDTESDRILMLDYCQGGKGSPLVERFKRAGLFDLEKILSELSALQDGFSEKGKKSYADLVESHRFLVESYKEFIRYMRSGAESLFKPAPKDEPCVYEQDRFMQILFFAATTHDPEKEQPDWDLKRAMDHIEQLRQKKNTDGVVWADMAPEALLVSAFFNPGLTRETIRRALRDDMSAMREMARHYANGENGFPRNTFLARY